MEKIKPFLIELNVIPLFMVTTPKIIIVRNGLFYSSGNTMLQLFTSRVKLLIKIDIFCIFYISQNKEVYIDLEKPLK